MSADGTLNKARHLYICDTVDPHAKKSGNFVTVHVIGHVDLFFGLVHEDLCGSV